MAPHKISIFPTKKKIRVGSTIRREDKPVTYINMCASVCLCTYVCVVRDKKKTENEGCNASVWCPSESYFQRFARKKAFSLLAIVVVVAAPTYHIFRFTYSIQIFSHKHIASTAAAAAVARVVNSSTYTTTRMCVHTYAYEDGRAEELSCCWFFLRFGFVFLRFFSLLFFWFYLARKSVMCLHCMCCVLHVEMMMMRQRARASKRTHILVYS